MEKKVINDWKSFRYRLFRMVSVGVVDEFVNQCYDVVSTGALIVNLMCAILNTFDGIHAKYGNILAAVEALTVLFFAVDYVLRVLTAPELYPNEKTGTAVRRYMLSFAGIVDILSFLPYYLPVFFPAGAAVFRMFRVVRILRLFRINAYYDSLNVITEVIVGKKQQLLSSVFIILVLMLASSLCMYSLEHAAQPEVFSNAFSGIWWSVSTLLTVGYGDIYPITTLGKAFGIVISFLGVGMVAIPTGIISAGFVEEYSEFKKLGEHSLEEEVRFIRIRLLPEDDWSGKQIRELSLPRGMLIGAVQRGEKTIIPEGDVRLEPWDDVVIGAEVMPHGRPVKLEEIILKENHPWNGKAIRDLDISRQAFIVMVKRNQKAMEPKGSLVMREGDMVFLYTKLQEVPGIKDSGDSMRT